MASNYEEYRHCVARGHVSDGSWISSGGITYQTCKFCKTEYWTEEVKHERNVPKQDFNEKGQ